MGCRSFEFAKNNTTNRFLLSVSSAHLATLLPAFYKYNSFGIGLNWLGTGKSDTTVSLPTATHS